MSESEGADIFVPGELQLTAGPAVNEQAVVRAETRRHYQQPYSVYVKRFGLSAKDAERALKRWVAKGRETDPADLPPFDQPELLAAWWRRHMKWRVPAWMELLEQLGPAKAAEVSAQNKKADGQSSKATDGAGQVGVAAEDLPPEFSLHTLPADAGDAEKELWQFANGFKAEMERARKERNTQKWWSAYTEYQKLLKELRAWEKDRLGKRLAAGTALEVATMADVLTRMFGTVAKSYLQGLLELGRQLAPTLSDQELRTAVYPIRDKVFRSLKETRFVEAVPPELVA